MVKLLSTVAVFGALVATPLHASREAPWFGTWQLNPARLTPRAEPSPYRKVTIRIEPWRDGLKVTYDMVGVRGGVTHLEWTGTMDGRESAVQGVDYVMTNAYRRLDAVSYEILVRVDGRPVARAVATVPPDGATLTVVTTERDVQGRSSTATAVYERR